MLVFWWACIRGDCIRSFTVFAKIIYVFQSLTTFVKEASSYMFDRGRNMSLRRFRSSRQEVFCQKGVLRNFSKFTGKHLCQILFFNKVAGLRLATLLKKRLWHRCFLVHFAEHLFFIEHLQWLLLNYYPIVQYLRIEA